MFKKNTFKNFMHSQIFFIFYIDPSKINEIKLNIENRLLWTVIYNSRYVYWKTTLYYNINIENFRVATTWLNCEIIWNSAP